ncbi:MAG: prolipoprotein diacylglyceryl transferase [Nanoarchaeota archaeon]|nr:prolipoprotein diacylglyceryl transferase [Nanoarchaeota archaeon]
MIPYKTFGELFSIGSFHVQAWGLMVAIGFLIGLFVITLEAKRRKLNLDSIYALVLFLFIGGVLGARIGWILTEAPSNLSFMDYLNIWNGGMVSFGGLIGGLIFMAIYAYYKKLNMLTYLDVFAIGIPLGHAIGRVGCYLIGDHLGKETVMPWAILMNGQLTHPIILYEIILLLGIFALMIYMKNKKLPKGSLFMTYLASYSVGRFFIDFFRVDPTYLGLTIAQYACIAFIILSGILLWRKKQ